MVGGHAIVGRLSNNVFSTIQAIRKIFEKVTERSRDSGRRSRDRRLTVKERFLDVWSNWKTFWKKSLNGHATVGQRSCDRRLTVKERFLDVWSNWKTFWKKSLNGHATVVGGHTTVGRLSINVFGRFKQVGKFLLKVAERSRDSGRKITRPSADCQTTFVRRFEKIRKFLRIISKGSRNSRGRFTWPSADFHFQCCSTFSVVVT